MNNIYLIYHDLLKYFSECHAWALGIAFLCAGIVGVREYYSKENVSWRKLLWTAVTAFYFLFFLYITLLMRSYGSRRMVELRPFISFYPTHPEFHYVIENILLFIPLGILFPIRFSFARRWKRMIGIALCLSLAVEFLQFVFRCGKSEVDDLIANVLGAVIGFGIYRVCQKLRKVISIVRKG